MCRMLIRIPLKRALTEMWVGLVKRRSKISTKKRVGELKYTSGGTPKSLNRQCFSVFSFCSL